MAKEATKATKSKKATTKKKSTAKNPVADARQRKAEEVFAGKTVSDDPKGSTDGEETQVEKAEEVKKAEAETEVKEDVKKPPEEESENGGDEPGKGEKADSEEETVGKKRVDEDENEAPKKEDEKAEVEEPEGVKEMAEELKAKSAETKSDVLENVEDVDVESEVKKGPRMFTELGDEPSKESQSEDEKEDNREEEKVADADESEDEEPPLEKKNKALFVVGIFLVVVVLVVTVGVAYLKLVFDGSEGSQVAEPVVTEEGGENEAVDEEKTEEVAQMTREEISLEVLNGTSVAGLAGRTAETFESLGYEVVEVGNADDDASENQLFVKEGDEEAVEVLLEDVGEELGIEEVTGVLEDSEVVARIVLGE